MSVVAYPHIIPQGSGPWIEVEQRNITSVNRSPLSNATKTLERPGAVWAFTVRYQNLTKANAARISAFLASCRGHAQRFYLPVWVYDRRGSGFGSELLTNGTFADGATGWTAYQSAVLTSQDYVMRAAAPSGGAQQGFLQNVAPTQYAPHALRSIIHHGRGSSGASALQIQHDLNAGATVYVNANGPGLAVAAGVHLDGASSAQYPLYFLGQSGYIAGDYAECSFASLARCALVDNGPNLLLHSSDGSNGVWLLNEAVAGNNGTAAPDGGLDAQYIVDTVNDAAHYIYQSKTVSSAVADYSFSVALHASAKTWARIEIQEATGGTSILEYVNLSTGALGASGATGANWANRRAFVADLGNGWFMCTVVGRKTNAATSLNVVILAADSDGDSTYAGAATAAILWWRATLAQSSVPTRLIETTAAATSGSSQTGGALHLKGLPASTNGLLLAGDWVQLPGIEQLVRARTALNSDAAGLGYFEFEPFLRASPADNSPVIVTNPLARCLLDSNSVRYSELADNVVDIEFVAVEDVVP